MNRIRTARWLGAAIFTVFAMACGTPTPTPTTDAGNSCSTDLNCATGKVCHPLTKQCIPSCTTGSDCTSAAKTCALGDGGTASTSSPGFCHCETDMFCANAIPGEVCQKFSTFQCSAKCTASSGCVTGYTCNTTTGVCAKAGTTTDGGTDGGTDAGVDAGVDAGFGCDSTQTQPDSCGYGSVCVSNNTCEVVTDGTCGNLANAKDPSMPTQARPAFNALTSSGAIIFNVVDDATNDDAACTSGQIAFTGTMYAYAPAGTTFPSTKSGLPGLYFFNSSGTPSDLTAIIRGTNYTQLDNGKMMSAKFTFCPTSGSTFSSAIAFSNGNGFCFTLNR